MSTWNYIHPFNIWVTDTDNLNLSSEQFITFAGKCLASELSTVGGGMHYLTKHEIGHSLTAICMHKIDKSIIIVSLFLLLQTRPHSNGQG